MKEIIIDKNKGKNKLVALLEDGRLLEKCEDTKQDKASEGNIYCGIVRNILPGMQSAFIDIGKNKNAFIYIKDIIPKVSNQTGNKQEELSKYNIGDYLKPNNSILVQVKKEEEGKKGAKVSKNISLTGRLCVLMINVDFITVSQKIENEEERKRLKQIASHILSKYKEKYGVILRTGALGKKEKEIQEDIEELITLWKKIERTYKNISVNREPKLIFKNESDTTKFLISVLETDISRITTNEKEVFNSVKIYLEQINKNDIELVLDTKREYMQIFGLEQQIEGIEKRKIWLKCGGFITIDKTEALTAIDVNSGKYIGNKSYNKENAVQKVNMEATIEIAKQLRLKNISGIIVIDYIDMEKDEEREEIINLLEKGQKLLTFIL
jgi:ribonuclease G